MPTPPTPDGLRRRVGYVGRLVCVLVMTSLGELPAGAIHSSTQGEQESDDGGSFEVASIKLGDPRGTRRAIEIQPGGRLHGINVTVTQLIMFAYSTPYLQIVNGPEWIRSERFDLRASLDASASRSEQMAPAVRTLLADRFKLVLRRETRGLEVYALTVARPDGRPGPALKPARTDCSPDAVAARRALARRVPSSDNATANRPGSCSIIATGDPTRFRSEGVTMSQFASVIAGQTGRVVVDRTELPGYWEFELIYAVRPNPGADSPSVFTAVQEDLGLRLQPSKAPVEVLIVERVERPTPD